MTRIELELPDLLKDALNRAGLLAPNEVVRLLRKELREQAFRRLDDLRAKAEADPEPPMTTEEIQKEIDAYRAEKRRAAGS